MSDAPTSDELIATWIASQLEDGESVWAGTNLAVPRAGLMLAHWSRCPNLRILLSFYQHNFSGTREMPSSDTFADGRLRYGAEMTVMDHRAAAFSHIRDIDVFFVGGLQVDRHGNTNLIGIDDGEGGFRVRGAGPAGATSFSAHSGRYYIYMTRHTPRVFVEECDFVSTVGPARRRELGLPGGGPQHIISPLGIMGFTDEDRIQLEATLPGVSVNEIVEQTGFDLVVPESVPALPDPSDEELRLLREQVDPSGYLRKEAKG